VEQKVQPQITAGLRGAHWDPALMRRPYKVVPYALQTADGQNTLGFLFTTTGAEKCVVSIMHPREMSVTHYLVPTILDAGCACWVQGPRSVGNDLRLEHEIALFDVAAGMSHLRQAGYESVVMLGNSGGAALYAFYHQQATLPPEQRITNTPGGRSTALGELEMPRADGFVFVSPHPGQGALLMSGIDPSVIDESDPMSVDASLDPFSELNGYDPVTRQARYAPQFVARYRAAQRQRVERIDRLARSLIERKQAARKRIRHGAATLEDRRLAAYAPIFQVWRTDADLRSWDIRIDPSDRKTGSLWGTDPFTSNWGSVAFGRTVTPESWLSTWSGISSNASFEKCAPSIDPPVLLIEYTGDQCTFPADIDAIYASLGSEDKVRVQVKGDHHGMTLAPGEESGREIAARHIKAWLHKQFATAKNTA
jgi:pimeloyl-ACP methyl ester carboxylesterase